MEPLAPLLPISKNLPVSDVQSLLIQRTSSEISSLPETAEIDRTVSQMEKLKMSQSHSFLEQKTVSTDSQERNIYLIEDSNILTNNSTGNGENQNR